MAARLANPAARDRMADAALLLLDAARASVAENEAARGPGPDKDAHALSLATQTLLVADSWPANGAASSESVAVELAMLIRRITGVGIGLGMMIGTIPDAGARQSMMLVIGMAVGKGQRLGAAMRERGPK